MTTLLEDIVEAIQMIDGLVGLLFKTTDPETKQLIYDDIKNITERLAVIGELLEEIIDNVK
ncbi:MAG: hypothetical protein GY938_27170 [Ketobacter sp.]|nr:hypothetical protein [Ketobacter sp.]